MLGCRAVVEGSPDTFLSSLQSLNVDDRFLITVLNSVGDFNQATSVLNITVVCLLSEVIKVVPS